MLIFKSDFQDGFSKQRSGKWKWFFQPKPQKCGINVA
jgi:hypothetical protein